MHRVRQSLPYFKQFGWEPTVLTVDAIHVEMAKDNLLEQSIPDGISIHKVSAYSTRYTRKLGLGNLGLRAFYQLYKKGNELLKTENFDLVYFSTTVFACMPLGRLWKQKFKVPFVIDMQDPWRNDYYLSVPKNQQPPKFWFAHRLNSLLEGFTIPKLDGIIAVSEGYVEILKSRYPDIANIPSKTLTFGAHPIDLKIASSIKDQDMEYALDPSKLNIIYAGVVPKNMLFAIEAIFKALKKGVDSHKEFDKIHFHFIGTNYATGSFVKSALSELIITFQLENHVTERELRVPYFEALKLVQQSNLAILPGTLDKNYTASKLYPYILAKIPMIAVFNESSSVVDILKELEYGSVVTFNEHSDIELLSEKVYNQLILFFQNRHKDEMPISEKFEKYLSEHLALEQAEFFNEILGKK